VPRIIVSLELEGKWIEQGQGWRGQLAIRQRGLLLKFSTQGEKRETCYQIISSWTPSHLLKIIAKQ